MSLVTSAGWLVWVLTLPGADRTPDVRVELPDPGIVQQAPPAQPAAEAETPGRGFFFSWGYNGDWFTKSDIHISQPTLGNDFTLVGVQARESKGWNELFSHALFVPQYNIRIGVFLNEKWGLEMALDHIKWIVRQDQQVPITGTLDGAPVDTEVTLTEDVLRYKLNNGANPIFVNVIRRVRLAGEPGRTGYFAFLAKAGGGFAVPHTENALFNQPNDAGFQPFHGWDLDAVAAARIHIFKPLYFEFEWKLVYARYFGVNVDQGKADHSVKASEYTWNFGLAFRE